MSEFNGSPELPFVPFDPTVHKRAYMAGKDVTEQLKDCVRCPGCQIYGRRELIGSKSCFRCRSRVQQPRRERQGGSPVNTAMLLLVALLTGVLAALLLR